MRVVAALLAALLVMATAQGRSLTQNIEALSGAMAPLPAGGVPSPAPGPEPATVGASGFTIADVAANSTPESCWVAVEDKVYDLTDWAPQHPGGPQKILENCGTDLTAKFVAKHGFESVMFMTLQTYEIGPLAANTA